jgi:DNA-binding PadR family transcriptional regulator
MSLKIAILGLLSIKPSTGYDIKTDFKNSINFIWNSDQTQIYKTLSEMIDENLVYSTTVHQNSKPSKKVYEITETGREQLRLWLLKPLKQKNQRNQELLQFFFLGQLTKEEILNNLKRMKKGIEKNLAALSFVKQNAELFDLKDKAFRVHFFFGKALELGILDAKLNDDWITGVIHEIEEGGLGNGE